MSECRVLFQDSSNRMISQPVHLDAENSIFEPQENSTFITTIESRSHIAYAVDGPNDGHCYVQNVGNDVTDHPQCSLKSIFNKTLPVR